MKVIIPVEITVETPDFATVDELVNFVLENINNDYQGTHYKSVAHLSGNVKIITKNQSKD